MKLAASPFAALMVIASLFSFASAANAQQENGCPAGTYDVVLTPDGGTITVLFDTFLVEAEGEDGNVSRSAVCQLHIPLDLPPNTSVGVYKVDYRGFALLAHRQHMELSVVYGFNDGRDHSYRHQIRGAHEEDFAFSQTIGAGLMRRVGCGDEAALDIEAAISVHTNGQPGLALATLDSLDGAPRGGLVYYLQYDKCTPGRN